MAAPPSTFKSGIDIKLSLSAAFSTQFNSRSLEANFSPPWIATLINALSFSSRFSVATEPYLTIPGAVIHQIQRNEEYKKAKAEQERLLNTIKELPQPQPETTNRRSARLQASNKELRHVRDRLEQEANLFTEMLEGEMSKAVADNNLDDIFFNELSFTAETSSVHDEGAMDLRPDISVAHIIGGSVRKPTREDAERLVSDKTDEAIQDKELLLLNQHKARAGIAIVHRCTPLIGEFKRVVGRANIDIVRITPPSLLEPIGDTDEDDSEDINNPWVHEVPGNVSRAVLDLMKYAAVYFLVHPRAMETVALASSGPFWTWSCIKRDQVPKFEWLSGVLVQTQENIDLRDAFNNKFGEPCFVLTTPESDIEINKMMKEISRITENCECNLPSELPTDFDFKLIPDTPCASYLATAGSA